MDGDARGCLLAAACSSTNDATVERAAAAACCRHEMGKTGRWDLGRIWWEPSKQVSIVVWEEEVGAYRPIQDAHLSAPRANNTTVALGGGWER